jgi:hypothetical protein
LVLHRADHPLVPPVETSRISDARVQTQIFSGLDWDPILVQVGGHDQTMGVRFHFFGSHVGEQVDSQGVTYQALSVFFVVFFKGLEFLLEDLFSEGFFLGVDVASCVRRLSTSGYSFAQKLLFGTHFEILPFFCHECAWQGSRSATNGDGQNYEDLHFRLFSVQNTKVIYSL